jgi:ubiquinone biosynthesis protein
MISVVSAVRDLGRLREITSVLVRHGFGEIVARAGFGRAQRADPAAAAEIPPEEAARGEDEKRRISGAARVRLVLQDLGPSFIKLGQILSTRPDVLPAELIAELKSLQDDVPAIPFEDIKGVLETSLGASIGELFLRFDEKPLATASIGQVHRALLSTPARGSGGDPPGEGQREVVVKVQRPGVAATVARDLELLHIMAAALERAVPETRIYSPVGLVQQFDQSITSELNYVIEADNAERFARNFEGHPEVRFPEVFRSVSSKHVLVLEYFDGKKIDAAVAAGASGPELARSAVGVVIKMIFDDGFFHADPHPGNIVILGAPEAPVIGLIDLGMVGRLGPELRDKTVDMLVAAVRKDSYAVADALYAIGRPTQKVDMREYRAEVSQLAEKYLGKPLKEIDLSGMIRDIVRGAMKFHVEIPTDFMLIGKSLMTIEGIGREIDPDLDVYSVAAPKIFEILRKRYSPQRISNDLWRGFEQLSRAGYDMPMQLREVLDDLRLGRLALRAWDPEVPRAADRLGRRLFMGLAIASLVVSGTLLLYGDRHTEVGVAMLVLAVIGWLGHALADLTRRPRR